MGVAEIIGMTLTAAFEVGKLIATAVTSGDDSELDTTVRDLLPEELLTTIERRKAEREAEQKFGTEKD